MMLLLRRTWFSVPQPLLLSLILAFAAGCSLSSEGQSQRVPSFDIKTAQWKTGDVLGMTEPLSDTSTLFFELATGSRFGHVGVVSVEDGEVFVYQADPPHTKKTPLALFVLKALKSDEANFQDLRLALRQIRVMNTEEQVQSAQNLIDKHGVLVTHLTPLTPLSPDEQQRIQAVMDEFVRRQIPYNHSQQRSRTALNCSEFVFEVFGKIGRTGIGQIQRISDVNLGALNGLALKLWNQMGNSIDMSADVISPASIVFSKQLRVVASDLPWDRLISDKEILEAWIDAGAFGSMLEDLRLPSHLSTVLRASASDHPFAREITSSRAASTSPCEDYLFLKLL